MSTRHWHKALALLAGTVALGMPAALNGAAVDYLLEIDGIPGESSDDTVAGGIDVLAWSWGMSNSGTMHTGSGGGAGKVNVQDLSFTKYVDKASPKLMLACASGKHIAKATLTLRQADATGGGKVDYLVITLEDLLVSSVSNSGSAGGGRPIESFSLNFAKVTYTYTPVGADGVGEPVRMTWDIPTATGGE